MKNLTSIFGAEIFWRIIGVAAAILTAIVTIIILAPKDKELQVTLLSNTTLLNPDIAGPPPNLRLIYQDREVSNISIIRIRIRNSGALPIKSEDIEKPIRIMLQQIEEIISAVIESSQPQDLSVRTYLRNNSVVLGKTLLNPDDQFIVKVTAVPMPNRESLVESVTGRIVGVRQIDFQPFLPTARREVCLPTSIVLLIVAAITAIFVYTFIYRIIKRRTRR